MAAKVSRTECNLVEVFTVSQAVVARCQNWIGVFILALAHCWKKNILLLNTRQQIIWLYNLTTAVYKDNSYFLLIASVCLNLIKIFELLNAAFHVIPFIYIGIELKATNVTKVYINETYLIAFSFYTFYVSFKCSSLSRKLNKLFR